MHCSDRRVVSRSCGVVFVLVILLVFFCSCTDYERMGVNPRPFNEPAQWENNPYGDVFQN